MLSVRRIKIGEAELFKQVRLASLQEAPYAFSSTYESALQRSPQSWADQADGSARGADRATFIAFAGDVPVGIAALYRQVDTPATGEMLQVWVAPEYRSSGTAAALLDALFQWAGANGFQTVVATITQGNGRALKFYQKYGFKLAEGTSPAGPDDTLLVKPVAGIEREPKC